MVDQVMHVADTRARWIEHKAERRLIRAWRRAAELRSRIEFLDY